MIRIGTVGTSVITEAFIGAVSRTDGIEVAAVSSRDTGRARAYADRFGIAGAYGSVDELYAAADIDAVYIGSPNAAHRDQAAAALAAGKHVLVEKPAVTTAAEWDALVAQAGAAGLVVLEAMRTAHDPGIAALREMLPGVGVLRRASLHYQKRSSRYDQVLAGETPNIFDPDMGGGALADLGVYGLHAAVLLFGEPEAVAAASVRIRTGVDGVGIALLEYPGFVADVAFSKITSSTRPSEVQGEEGTLVIDHIPSPRHLELTRNDGSVETVRLDERQDGLDGEVAAFVEFVEGRRSAAEYQAATAATLRVVERVRDGGSLV